MLNIYNYYHNKDEFAIPEPLRAALVLYLAKSLNYVGVPSFLLAGVAGGIRLSGFLALVLAKAADIRLKDAQAGAASPLPAD